MPTLVIILKRTNEVVATITRGRSEECLQAARAAFPENEYNYKWEEE